MKIEYLDVKEQEEFTRIVNTLLAESCIFQYTKIKILIGKKEMQIIYSLMNIMKYLKNIFTMRVFYCIKIVPLIWECFIYKAYKKMENVTFV